MSARRHRRDFVLDSGAISALAGSGEALLGFLRPLRVRYDGVLVLPIPVLTEVYSGNRASDVLVDRLLTRVAAPHERFADLGQDAAKRAGVLRGLTVRRTGLDISAIDAQVVAIAEERSFINAVTIVTGDVDDVTALVQTTGRPNIAVDPI